MSRAASRQAVCLLGGGCDGRLAVVACCLCPSVLEGNLDMEVNFQAFKRCLVLWEG